MFQAYRAGLLSRDYPHGVRSVLRENHVLDMMAAELSAKAARKQLEIESSFIAPLISAREGQSVLNTMRKNLKFFHALMEGDVLARLEKSLNPEQLTQLYALLEKSGILKDSAEEPEHDA